MSEVRPLVEILFFAGFPNHAGAIELVERVSRGLGVDPELRVLEVSDQEAALRLRFLLADDPRRRARRRPARGAQRLCLVLPCLSHRGRHQRTAGRALGARGAPPRGDGRLTMLEHLFDAELVYRSELEPLTEDGKGKLIGSGDGTVTGPAIAGQLSWTLFERPGKLVCAMNPVAVIETAEGARVRIEARGFARRANEASRRWAVAATLRFESEHERYRWLERTLGVWEGEFDAEAHRAHYQAYLVRDGLNSDQP